MGRCAACSHPCGSAWTPGAGEFALGVVQRLGATFHNRLDEYH